MSQIDRNKVCSLTRRGFLAAAAVASIAPQALRAASSDATPASSPSADGPWSFVDDRGKSVSLPHRPTRIVAQTTAASSLWDCGIQVAGIFGPAKRADGTKDFQAGSIDLDKVVSLGDYGELDIEKLIGLNAELYIDMTYGTDMLWYLTGNARTQVEAMIPVMGITMEKLPMTHTVGRFEELAVSLGADLTTPAYLAAKQGAADDAAAFKAAVAANPGLKVLVTSPTAEQVYIASPDMMTDLAYFETLGLDVVRPTLPADTADTVYFFETISWEQVGTYPADIILVDARDPAGVSQYQALDIWKSLPAVKAGQVGPWRASQQYSWAGISPVLKELTTLIESSKKIIS